MSFSANDSRIQLTPEQEKHISKIQPEEIKQYLRTIAESQGLIYRDAFDHNIIHEVENPTLAPTRFTRNVRIDAREIAVEADSELELERKVGDMYRGAQAVREEEAATTTRQAAPTATESAEQIANRVELELAFKRGTITTQEYLERSGAVTEYLEKQGVPIEDLREAVQEKSSTRFEKSWANATQEFLNSREGADWPGGNENLEIIGQKLQQLGLTDAEDKVQALAQAYAAMKQSGTVQENTELTQRQKIEEATSSNQIHEILSGSRFSTMFDK
jgi:hypothetical protein